MLFFLMGEETTGLTLASAIIEIFRHPSVVKKLQEEVDAVNPDPSTAFNPTHLSKLEYLGYVISETFRLQPVIPRIGRVAERDFTHQGYFIPKGSTLSLQMFVMGRTGIQVCFVIMFFIKSIRLIKIVIINYTNKL